MSSTNITSSGTLTYSSGDGTFSYSGSYTGDINTWPITVSADVTVTFGSNLTLTTTNQYFIIGGTGVTIDGAGYEVDFSDINTQDSSYGGFIGGGQERTNVQNIGCIDDGSGQVGPYISIGNFTANSSISNCYVICSGNMTGAIAGGSNLGTISNCYVICSGNMYFGGIAGSNNSGSISNCYAIIGDTIEGGGIASDNNSGSISNCYVICGGGIIFSIVPIDVGGGIAGRYNSGDIYNCYAIIGGIIQGGGIASSDNSGSIYNCYAIIGGTIQGGGIAAHDNSGNISNCYAIIGGDIDNGGGIAGSDNSETISNCYVIIGGDIDNEGGGIAAPNNSGNISNCYAIIGGDITSSGGIAGRYNLGIISDCYVNYKTKSNTGYFIAQNVNGGTGNNRKVPAEWTSDGADYLTPSGWTNTDSTNITPWVLSAFDTAIASSTTATSASGNIALNTYGQSFLNGSVYSGTNGATFTYNAPSNISYSGISSGTTYTLGLYAYELLSNLTSITFTFTNDAAIQTAFNYTGTSANDIVPYEYSVTEDVTLYLAISPTNYYSSTSGSDLIDVFELYASGTKTTTNYQVNGQDLSDIFQPYSSGTKAETTGITVNGDDLNNIFEIKTI